MTRMIPNEEMKAAAAEMVGQLVKLIYIAESMKGFDVRFGSVEAEIRWDAMLAAIEKHSEKCSMSLFERCCIERRLFLDLNRAVRQVSDAIGGLARGADIRGDSIQEHWRQAERLLQEVSERQERNLQAFARAN
jgi:hypothetical protein